MKKSYIATCYGIMARFVKLNLRTLFGSIVQKILRDRNNLTDISFFHSHKKNNFCTKETHENGKKCLLSGVDFGNF